MSSIRSITGKIKAASQLVRKRLTKSITLDWHIDIPSINGMVSDLATCASKSPRTIACFAVKSRLCVLDLSSGLRIAFYVAYGDIGFIKVSPSASTLQMRWGRNENRTVLVDLPLDSLEWEELLSEDIADVGVRMESFWGLHGKGEWKGRAEVYGLEMAVGVANIGGWGVNAERTHCAFVDNKLITFGPK